MIEFADVTVPRSVQELDSPFTADLLLSEYAGGLAFARLVRSWGKRMVENIQFPLPQQVLLGLWLLDTRHPEPRYQYPASEELDVEEDPKGCVYQS